MYVPIYTNLKIFLTNTETFKLFLSKLTIDTFLLDVIFTFKSGNINTYK